MSSDHDTEDWLEAVLHQAPPAPTPDGGFSRRLSAALPARDNPYRWVAPAGLALGMLLAAVLIRGWALPAASAWLAAVSDPSLPSISSRLDRGQALLTLCGVALIVLWSTCAWALSNDHPDLAD